MVGRFINADEVSCLAANGDFASYNLFCYCGNHPIDRKDAGGNFWNFVIGGVVGGIIGGLTAAANGGDAFDVVLGIATGAIGGVIGASGLHAVVQAGASAALSAICNIGSAIAHNRPVDPLDVIMDAGISAAGSLIGSALTKKAADAADSLIKKGINRIISGKTKLDAGSRYWKGAIKRGLHLVRIGVHNLNVARGQASVIGTVASSAGSIAKQKIKEWATEA